MTFRSSSGNAVKPGQRTGRILKEKARRYLLRCLWSKAWDDAFFFVQVGKWSAEHHVEESRIDFRAVKMQPEWRFPKQDKEKLSPLLFTGWKWPDRMQLSIRLSRSQPGWSAAWAIFLVNGGFEMGRRLSQQDKEKLKFLRKLQLIQLSPLISKKYIMFSRPSGKNLRPASETQNAR